MSDELYVTTIVLPSDRSYCPFGEVDIERGSAKMLFETVSQMQTQSPEKARKAQHRLDDTGTKSRLVRPVTIHVSHAPVQRVIPYHQYQGELRISPSSIDGQD